MVVNVVAVLTRQAYRTIHKADKNIRTKTNEKRQAEDKKRTLISKLITHVLKLRSKKTAGWRFYENVW